MKKKIISLKVVSSTGDDRFNEKVKELLSFGYLPFGKLITHRGNFCQQFVEFEKMDSENV